MISSLKTLCQAIGVAGDENSACQAAKKLLSPFCNDVVTDPLGNVIACIKKGTPHIMLEAHIDEIGMIVSYIDDNGFVKVSNCGGVDRRLLLANEVIIHGTKEIKGIVAAKPPHTQKGDESKSVPSLDDIFIDIGYTKEQASEYIQLGDRVTFASKFLNLQNNRISVKALDDRAGVVTILEALKKLDLSSINCGLSVLFSTQEETGERGAKVAAYTIAPDISISVDVSFAYTSDTQRHKCGIMGKGAMIGIAPTLTKSVSQKLINIAKEKQIPYQLEVMGGSTGTNADVIGVTKGGIATGLISIPIKYMHTPIESCQIEDLDAVSSLLSEFVKAVSDNA